MKFVNTFSIVYRREIFLISLVGLLLTWAISSTALALRNKPKVTLIGIEKTGAYVIGKESIAREAVAVTFIRHFLILFYSHDKNSFKTNTELATNLMSEDLFNELKNRILQEQNETEKYSQAAEVVSVSLIESDTYQAQIRMKYFKDLSESSNEFKVILSTKESPFYQENPWGFEITRLEERRID